MLKKVFGIIAVVCCVLCSVTGAQAGTISVMVSIVPQKYFVEKIAGDLVDVSVMVAPGASPATYEPRPGQMMKLADSAAFFAVGVPFEKAWLERFADAAPNMRIVHTDKDVPKVPMAAHLGAVSEHDGHDGHEEHEEHGHGDEHHHHGTLDPHIWMSPPLVKIQARTIRDALKEIDPVHGAAYQAGCDAFEKEIDALDHQIKGLLAGSEGKAFMVFHPAYGYFADAFDLVQIPIEVEGKSPSPRELAKFISLAKEKDVRAIFVQPQFSKKSAETIARAVGAQVEVIDPLAPDWDANLLSAARAVKAAVR